MSRIKTICFLLVAVFGMAAGNNIAVGQQDVPEELKAPLEKITESIVTSTVSFLSSDEMLGRDTPSPELTIASSYVAARFRGAGLTGAGDNGSFFQTTEIKTVSIPKSGIVAERNGNAIDCYGLMSAGSEPFVFEGEVELITDETPKDKQFSGPVSIVIEKFKSRRDQGNAIRSFSRLKQKWSDCDFGSA